MTPAPATEDKETRLSIPLAADGSIAWDRMRPSTQETVKRLVGSGTSAAPQKLNPLVSHALVTALVSTIPLLAATLARMFGATVDSAMGLGLTDQQKAELTPLYQAALADYAITLGKHENLIIALGTTAIMLGPGLQGLKREKKAKPGERGPNTEQIDTAAPSAMVS